MPKSKRIMPNPRSTCLLHVLQIEERPGTITRRATTPARRAFREKRKGKEPTEILALRE